MKTNCNIRISVIIPAYNASKFISHCLNGLLRQDLEKDTYEILIVNDGSKDNTLEICKAYAEEYSQIKVFDKANGGVGSARNYGLSVANGT